LSYKRRLRDQILPVERREPKTREFRK